MRNKIKSGALSVEMDDTALIAAHQSGDSTALGVLMQRHRSGLMGFLTLRVGIEAEDLYQETWSRAAKAMPTYQEQGTFKAWIYQIARRLIIDHRRRRGARIQVVLNGDSPLHEPTAAGRPDERVAAYDIARVFEHALSTMQPETAQVARLRIIDGVSFKEIARRQDVPLNTALGRMHRALQKLRQELIDAELLHTRSPL